MSGKIEKILSIDGGGIRGIIPATVLAELESRAGRPTAELFDLVVGSSTGGILALALTAASPSGGPAYSAAGLVELYEREGQRVFSRSILHRVRSLGNLIGPKYPLDGLTAVLKQYLGTRRLSEALSEVIVTAYDLHARSPYLFKRKHAQTGEQPDFFLWQVGVATGVAPTYFPPLRLGSPGGELALVDGGLVANNPTMIGLVEGLKLAPERPLVVVSLGTGQFVRSIPFERARRWGVISWARPALDVVFDGVSDTVDYQVRQVMAREQMGSYFRFQGRLTQCSDRLDDVRPQNVAALQALGREIVRQHDHELNQLVQLLRQ